MLPAIVCYIVRIAGTHIRLAVFVQTIQLRGAEFQLHSDFFLLPALQTVKSLYHHPLINKEGQGFEISAVQL
ncbi:hypothetical protein D3C71_2029470 [compost metagenome]